MRESRAAVERYEGWGERKTRTDGMGWMNGGHEKEKAREHVKRRGRGRMIEIGKEGKEA